MVATLIILAVAIVGFMSGRIPIGIVAVAVAVSLYLTGVLDLNQALAGFGDPTVIFIATLFVVSESLDSTGVTAWAGGTVIKRAGRARRRLVLVTGLLVAVVTAFVSVNGSVAALIPMVVVVAMRAKIPPSQLLLPLAFTAHAGSLLTLTGSPVNIIVSDLAAETPGGRHFGYFEFALAGLPLLAGTIAVTVLLGKRLLPHRTAGDLPTDLSAHTVVLRRQYDLPAGLSLATPDHGVAEVTIAPRSNLIGKRLFPGMTTPSGDLVVIGLQRGGVALTGTATPLQAGDTLLLSGSWDHLERHTSDPDEVLVVTPPAALRRGVPLGPGAKRALVVLGAMVVVLATGVLPTAIAGLLAVIALVLLRVVSPTQAYNSISWTTVVLIAGMIPLSTAFVTTGTADLLARNLLSLIGDSSPTVALLAICILTVILGQLISNTATVLIVAPVAITVAGDLDVSVLPFMMALAVTGAAAFLTPVATPANTMVMEPGAYRFGDYWRLGLPLLLMYLLAAVFWVPVVLPF